MSPQNNYSAGMPIYGGSTPVPRTDLKSPCVPFGWQISYLVGPDGDGDVLALAEVDLGPRVDMFHWVVE